VAAEQRRADGEHVTQFRREMARPPPQPVCAGASCNRFAGERVAAPCRFCARRRRRGHPAWQWERAGAACPAPVRRGAFPVCSPKLLKGKGAMRTPADLGHAVLLHVNDRQDWRRWLDAAHVDGIDLARGPLLNQASMAIDAAVDAQGVALARTALAAWDLIGGRLVRPFSLALQVPYAYWIVCPKTAAKLPKIVAFSEGCWLKLRKTSGSCKNCHRAPVNQGSGTVEARRRTDSAPCSIPWRGSRSSRRCRPYRPRLFCQNADRRGRRSRPRCACSSIARS
jgi:LysR substrate binding domain